MVQMGVPAVAPWDRWHLESAGMQVRSLVWHSWLRIQYCHRCSLGCCGGLDLISGLGYDMLWVGQKKKNGTDELIYRAETDSDMENRLVVAEGERGGSGWTGSLGLVDANNYI